MGGDEKKFSSNVVFKILIFKELKHSQRHGTFSLFMTGNDLIKKFRLTHYISFSLFSYFFFVF